jgi:hypothetical protein
MEVPKMSTLTETLRLTKDTNETKTWRVTPVKKMPASRPLLSRVFGRREPTTYQRCLAVHLFYAGPRGGLS